MTDREERKADYFISYNKADRHWAEWIAWILEEVAGYDVVIQEWDFKAGSNFVLEMQSAMKRSKKTIAVLSPDYFQSSFTQPEWAGAFAQDPTGATGNLITVRVRECRPEGLLAQVIYIDLVDLDEEAAEERLLYKIAQQRAKPEKRPRFPGSIVVPKPAFPGEQDRPVLTRRLPYEHNPNFVGRERTLAALKNAFSDSMKKHHPQVLTGMGGVGKTQLAIEFAHRNQVEYRMIAWIHADDESLVIVDYRKMAVRLGILSEDADGKNAVAAVRDWLERNDRWLLIYDNVDDVKSLREFLPGNHGGHVLITSRNPNWSSLGSVHKIEVLMIERAVELLSKRSGREREEEAHASALAELLGRLPLALEQAAAYVEETGITFAEYISLFEEHSGELLKKGPVAATWEISFLEVGRKNAAAIEFLQICSYLAADDIPLSLFERLFERLALYDVIAILRRYSLIERVQGNDSISIHRLIQLITRENMDPDTQKKRAEVALSLFEVFVIDVNDIKTWEPNIKYIPHGVAASNHALRLGVALDEAADLAQKAGALLFETTAFKEAEVQFEKAYRIKRDLYGDSSVEVSDSLVWLGSICRQMGRMKEAEGYYRRALDIRERAWGIDHPDNLALYNNLADVFIYGKNPREAQRYLEKVVATLRPEVGPLHPQAVSALNNYAEYLREVGDYSACLDVFHEVRKLCLQIFGEGNQFYGTVCNNLGITYRDLGQFEKAEEFLREAVQADERVYGTNHIVVARDVTNLGLLMCDVGKLEESMEYFEKARDIYVGKYGSYHHDVAVVLNNIGLVLDRQHRLDEALGYYEKALEIDRQVHEDNYSSIASRLLNIGMVYLQKGDLDRALEYTMSALETDEVYYGKDHLELVADCRALYLVHAARREYEKALHFLWRMLAIEQRYLGEYHSQTLATQLTMVNVLWRTGQNEEAKELFQDWQTKSGL